MKSSNLKKLTFMIGAIVLVVALAACGAPAAATSPENEAGAEVETPDASEGAVAPVPPEPVEAVLKVTTDGTLGQILIGNNDMTLYTTTNDAPDTSNCNAACLAIWTPLYTLGKPDIQAGVDATMVGKITLADGKMMVTYNHMPLYFYTKDLAVGDTLGQKVAGKWFVIGPDGKQITQ